MLAEQHQRGIWRLVITLSLLLSLVLAPFFGHSSSATPELTEQSFVLDLVDGTPASGKTTAEHDSDCAGCSFAKVFVGTASGTNPALDAAKTRVHVCADQRSSLRPQELFRPPIA